MKRAALLLVSSMVACSSPSTSDLFESPTGPGGTAGSSSGGDTTGTAGSTGMAGDSIDVGGTAGVGGSSGGDGGAAGASDGGSGPGGGGGSGQTGGSGMGDASVADASDAGRTTRTDARVRDSGTATDGPSKDVGRVTCDPDTFPGFDDGCTNSQSCSIGLHQVDCCGTLVAIGFNHAFVDSFDKAEASWRAACPANCGCPPGPTRTSDGDSGDTSDVAVRCEDQFGSFGSCVTYFP